MENNCVELRNLGLIDYKEAWDYQENLFDQIVAAKQQKRELKTDVLTPNFLLFCEHPHVYTIGKSGKDTNLLINEQMLKRHGASLYKINRGGDITYHGPGQLVTYPILDLDNFKLSIKSYIDKLEEVIIRTLNRYGVVATRSDGATGVWLDATNHAKARKICAIGVRTSHWVSMHGFAFNISTDLSYFEHIIPCGIQGKSVTSLEKELGRKVEMEEVREFVLQDFEDVFNMKLTGL
jgi:lipoyl(octanoyl) transferase